MKEKKGVSLRRRQTQLTQDTILDASFKLFARSGYNRTTVQDVADHAGVGVATVFRYFRSKLGLLTSLRKRDLLPVFAAGDKIIDGFSGDPVAGIMSLLRNLFTIVDAPSKQLESTAYSRRRFDFSKPEVGELLAFADEQSTAQIRRLLDKQQNEGLIAGDLDTTHMAAVVFQVFNHHYYELDHNPDATRDEVLADLAQRIEIVLRPWVTASN